MRTLLIVALVGLCCSEVSAQGIYWDRDGLGFRVQTGGITMGTRIKGPIYSYNRMGNYQFYRNSYGTTGTRYYNGYRGVTQYNYSNPRRGRSVVGELPYPGNYYAPAWSYRTGW